MRSVIAATALVACLTTQGHAQSVEYRSHAGVAFRSQADTGAVARAQAAHAADPANIDKLIALGLAQATVRQYHDAIRTLSLGMKSAPDNPILYRWRGHRYISIGQFDKALADLTRGNALDSTNYDIWYHLGVAHFERGEFAKAADAFTHARRRAPNDNELAGSTDWLWMSLARAHKPAEAQKALAAITDSTKITTATAYGQRLKLYRGVIGPDQVIGPSDTAAVQVATMSFGVGNWYLVKGDTKNARAWFKRAVDSGGWPGFGFFAAENELRRLR